MADASFKQEFLETHNQYRRKHQAPDVMMNESLCRSAQQWADHLLKKKSFIHSHTDHGENLFYSYSSGLIKLTGKEAVDEWYSEIKDYKFGKPGFQTSTGHFTQVVWKSSTDIGVGLAADKNSVYVVAQYSPAGNISSSCYFEKNVLPACK